MSYILEDIYILQMTTPYLTKRHTLAVFLGVYVDDILLTGDEEYEIQAFKHYLDQTFKIKDLGEAHYFLGIDILAAKDGLILTQRKFPRELLKELRDSDSSPMVYPLDSTQKLSATDEELFSGPSLYRKIVGKLNFLIKTRVDLAFTV